MVARKRLFQVAKEYNITSEALLKMLKELGFEVRSHMSTASDQVLEAIDKKFRIEKESIKQEIEVKKLKTIEREKKEYDEYMAMEKPPTEKIIRYKQLVSKYKEEKRKKRRKDKKKKKKIHIVDQKQIADTVKKTLARLDVGVKKIKYKRRPQKETVDVVEDENVIHINEFMSVAELAAEMGIKPTDLIAKCMSLGMMVSINQRLDMDTIQTLALEYELKTSEIKELGTEEIDEEEEEEELGVLEHRPPVVTVMGHVDHGKTSLLDYIRETRVVDDEAGQITQHIGAYRVSLTHGDITFLDTPGHAAFTAMRARGAQITDIVVLVVAANDSVQQQTIEAINHARAAGVPIIVAINKMDLPDANSDAVRQALTQQRLNPEEWGGKTVMLEISAKTGMGIDILLENILLQADVLELEANYEVRARGVVVEAKLEKGKGSVVTVIVQSGILRVGDPFVMGNYYGKVRAITDDRGTELDAAFPGWPAQITGIHGVPQAGDNFYITSDESVARQVAIKRQRIKREQDFRQMKRIALTNVFERIKEGEVVDLNIVIKGDVDGSVEVLSDTLQNLSTSEVRVQIIHRGVGAINENDVLLAAASNAIIIGFQVRPDARARELAMKEKVDVRLYTIIYDIENDIRAALEGLLSPEVKEEFRGSAEIRDLFRIPKVGTVAGTYIVAGKIGRNDNIRVIRDGVVIHDGLIGSLKRFKDDAKEVASGFECGIRVEGFNDVKVGDTLEAYVNVEVTRKL